MSRFGALVYSFSQGIKNIKRNKLFSIASMATMATCIFLFGILYFILVNVSYVIERAETNVGVSVFFNPGIADERVTEIGEIISDIDGVSSCQFMSAEDTWEYYKKEYLTEELAETFADDNPLEDSMSYTVFFRDIDKQINAVEQIKKIAGVRKVNDSRDVINTLTKINRGLSFATVAIVILLLAIATFLISTTITMGVSVRRREISIMHLIGATDTFIRGPFLVEGMLIGLLGACIPLSILYAVYYKVIAAIYSKFIGVFSGMNFVDIKDVFAVVTPLSLCMGVGIGLLGSSYTLTKQLKRIKSL
ncbi:MAG: permease-like cell division protein FtsX [Clostridiales bacterium]|nr:permease-like cell division protein FtsX [Clostridiales bacterium]